MNYYMGVDIGTSSAKAIAYTDAGEVVARRAVAYGMRHPAQDRSEQDPEEIVRAVGECIRGVVGSMQQGPVMVAFSAAMHSLLAVDGMGRPLTACMIWADNRAAAVAEDLLQCGRGKEYYRRTGVPVHAMTPLCKLIWLKEHDPGVFAAAARFVGIKEYVLFQILGEWLVDSGIASATGLLNIRTLEWDEDILHTITVDHSRLARVVPPGFVRKFEGGRIPLPLEAGTPVVIGGSDGAMANLASGAIGGHAMAITIGTSGAVRKVVCGADLDPDMRSFCYHVKGDLYIRGGATNNGAVVIQWLKERLLGAVESYEELFALAGMVEAGSEDLLFLPYILGERAPIWDSRARGVFFGLDIRHSKGHLIRAAMEGILYGLYSIGNSLGVEPGAVLHATGGFVKSALWLQMLADVFDATVYAFDEEDSSALGAVLLGLEAIGISIEPGASQAAVVYEPDAGAHRKYLASWVRFERLYRVVKNEY